MPLPTDHDERMQRARLALDGLSVGDGFGNYLCTPEEWVSSLCATKIGSCGPSLDRGESVGAEGCC
jgi:hypothetical protein